VPRITFRVVKPNGKVAVRKKPRRGIQGQQTAAELRRVVERANGIPAPAKYSGDDFSTLGAPTSRPNAERDAIDGARREFNRQHGRGQTTFADWQDRLLDALGAADVLNVCHQGPPLNKRGERLLHYLRRRRARRLDR
jgi:hypothetical protein